MKKSGEKCWRLGSCVSSFDLVEGGLDSPLTGLLSGSLISSADVDSLFQDLDSDGRWTPEGRWFAATSWRSLSTSWLSSSPGRRAPSPTPADPWGASCLGVLRLDPRTLVSNLNSRWVLYATLHLWRMCVVDFFVIYFSSRVLSVRAWLF